MQEKADAAKAIKDECEADLAEVRWLTLDARMFLLLWHCLSSSLLLHTLSKQRVPASVHTHTHFFCLSTRRPSPS